MGTVLASNFLVPNGTFIVELIAFLLVLWALRRWVLPYVNDAMEQRQATIRAALEDAEAARRRHEEAEAEYKRAIDDARAEARGIVEEANRFGEELRADFRSRAEQEYERIVGRAQADIDAAARRATQELTQQVSGLVITVVERVVGEGFTEPQQRQLVDRLISEVQREAGTTAEVSA